MQSSNLILFLAILHTIKKKEAAELMQGVERVLALCTGSFISAGWGPQGLSDRAGRGDPDLL